MLQFIVILLCIPSSLALVDSIHDTKDTGDLYPMVWQDQFDKNFVHFAVYNNYKTGENITEPSYSTRFGITGSPRVEHIYYGLYWEATYRDEDHYPDEEAVACAYTDLDEQLLYEKPELVSDQSRIEVGESRMSGNGTVRVKCNKFGGNARRVSEALSGCYYNGTVYQNHEEWEEPNPGNDRSLWKKMSCQRSENGYFESKLVGCSIHETHNWTNVDNSVETWVWKVEYRLNEITDPYYKGKWEKCVENEPGVVKLEKMPEDYEPVCKVDNVVHKDIWDDDVKGVRWECNDGRVRKLQCKIGKSHYVDPILSKEVPLPNGCKFICNPQTNVFKCDESLSMFKVEGKPRKMRKYNGSMHWLRH
ncbi:hypothetical protein L3Y34_003225 [Caenorhabditis briggsae]|uniref:Uncharacterized protein n=1 Tax=Caenorhabditis briggsae TaxID=6238 RepID=A0AAE9D3E2_CAEBR|nr:hypothetical protein L3Y34_003225 [Caenorhabditis briggsae]